MIGSSRLVGIGGFALAALAFGTLGAGLARAAEGARPKFVKWKHLSSKTGDIPAPGPSTQQTACQVFDVDKDGVNDFVIASRRRGPAVLWYRRLPNGWKKYIVENATLQIEAGGAWGDIDGDGDPDLVFGADGSDTKVWWWENPYPNYDPHKTWRRRYIKRSGARKHHDEILGDFDGDGRQELVFWNQGARKLFLTKIPPSPKSTRPWVLRPIYSWTSGPEHEGLAKADIDGDGTVDIVGGGNWYKFLGGNRFGAYVIDRTARFTRAAAGQIVRGGRPEVVFVPGDARGRLKWYECKGDPRKPASWVAHDLLGFDVNHGHSLAVADINGDGNADIFCAEMYTPGAGPKCKMWIFYGDGRGNFTKQVIATGIGNHESRVADLDGDGDLDILDKPYTADTPRVDIWLNEGTRE